MAIQAIVTSTKPLKLDGVRRAFEEVASNGSRASGDAPTVQITGMQADSGIFHGQPWGLQHTYEGACCRIEDVKRQLKRAGDAVDGDGSHESVEPPTFLVSAENGVQAVLSHEATMGVDTCVVVVEEVATNCRHFGVSPGRPYPLAQVQEMKRMGASNQDIARFCHDFYTSVANLPVSREEQVRVATRMALAQFGADVLLLCG